MAKLTEKQAWQVVLLAFSEPPGICKVLTEMFVGKLISENTYDQLAKAVRVEKRDRVRAGLIERDDSYLWPVSSREARRLFAHRQIVRCDQQRKRKKKA